MKSKTKFVFFPLAAVLIALACGKDGNKPAGSNCDRACLEGFAVQTLDALVGHNPSPLPKAKDVKYTENGQRLFLGDGLWNTASARGTYSLTVADTQAGQAVFFGTIRENGSPAILAMRLKIENRSLSEIEILVARDTAGAVRLEKLGVPHPAFLAAVPRTERASREDLIKTADLYFTGLARNDGKGFYPFTEDCERIENGKQTTHNPSNQTGSFDFAAMGCKEQFESGFFRFVTRIRDRRFVAVDPERGLAMAFVFFDHAGNVPFVRLTDGRKIPIGVKRPWTWEIAELFKVERGLISRIEAIVQEAPYGMNSGWSTWEDGLSERARE
ncbi:MAG TPA: hypothetical protein VGB38_02040 [bacterium]